MGDEPVHAVTGTFDGPATMDPLRRDIVVANKGDGTVSVILNNGGGSFTVAAVLPVGEAPLAVEAADFDGDGDLDLAVVANDPEFGPAIRVLENLTPGPGTVSFAVPVTYTVDATPLFLASADFNGDDEVDLVTVNSGAAGGAAGSGGAGPAGGSVSVLLNTAAPAEIAPCPADVNGDGVVNILDLIELIMSLGLCDNPGDCPADINHDGVVDLHDVIALLASFGPCPGFDGCPWDVDGDGTVGPSDLQSLLQNLGPCQNPDECPWDFDGDGVVDLSDLLALLFNFGPCP